MTKAQNSFLKAIPDILQELEFNPPADAKRHLIAVFDNNGIGAGNSVWDIAIQSVLRSPNPDRINDLIKQLSEQAADNAWTMSKIVGWDATLILLKIYGESQHKNIQTKCGIVAINPK